MKEAFDAASLERHFGLCHSSEVPVFIVGMPRSGATLMERIIASHSRAAGAGELAEMTRIAGRVAPDDDLRRLVVRARGNLTPETVTELAEAYLEVLRQGREEASRVVDKLAGNFLHLGLITTLFPNAAIIHARRMIKACGLTWEVDSLEFHQREAVVKIASLSQVRQPVYTTSQMRWVNYAGHIGELANLLAEFADDDRELLIRHGIELRSSKRRWLRRIFS